MKFPAIITLLPLAAFAIAAPTDISPEEVRARMSTSPADAKDVLKRTPGNVYFCTGSNWSHTCQVLSLGLAGQGNCQTIPEPWFESTGSIGPDPGALCFLSSTNTAGACNSKDDLNIAHPGFSDLYNHDGLDYGHSARYISCEGCSGCP